MTWSDGTGSGSGSGSGSGQQGIGPGQLRESRADREARIAWEQGGTSLLPSAGRLADRVTTVVLLAAGAVLMVVVGIALAVVLVTAAADCRVAQGCSPGAVSGNAALGAAGTVVVGVVTVVAVVILWVRRRPTWWIAAIGLVLAVVCVVVGGVGVADALSDHGSGDVRRAAASVGVRRNAQQLIMRQQRAFRSERDRP